MNKAEELREIFNDLPQDESERVLEQFMSHATRICKEARMCDELISKKVVCILIPYRNNIISLSEMRCFYTESEENEYVKIVCFTPEIKYPVEENEELKKVFNCSINPTPIDKNEKGYILAKKLVEEGFLVKFVFYKEARRFWRISAIEVFF